MKNKMCNTFAVFGIAILLSISTAYCQGNAVENIKDTVGIQFKIIADEYYKQIKQINRKQNELSERSHRVMSDEKFPVPTEATGKVLNIKGEPIENAEITITKEASDILLGKGKTDENGNFHISLNQSNYRGLTIEVLKNTYGRMALSGIYGGIVDYEIRLGRDINEFFFTRIVKRKKTE